MQHSSMQHMYALGIYLHYLRIVFVLYKHKNTPKKCHTKEMRCKFAKCNGWFAQLQALCNLVKEQLPCAIPQIKFRKIGTGEYAKTHKKIDFLHFWLMQKKNANYSKKSATFNFLDHAKKMKNDAIYKIPPTCLSACRSMPLPFAITHCNAQTGNPPGKCTDKGVCSSRADWAGLFGISPPASQTNHLKVAYEFPLETPGMLPFLLATSKNFVYPLRKGIIKA